MIITFECYECGTIVKALVRKGKLSFSIRDKQYSEKDCLSNQGYFVCIDCHKRTRIKFDKVYP